MSVTAYQQVERHWPAVLSALRAATGPAAGDAWRATCRLRWMPLALPEPLPELAAARFKTALGLTRPLGAWLILNPGSAARPLHELVPPQGLMRRLDAEGWLIGAHQVCAGPPRRIVEAWEALCTPSGGPLEPAQAVATADRAAERVSALWAILGVARQLIREGRTAEAPTWAPAGPIDPTWPEVLRLLRSDGPGALVRELPRFEPEWALHVWAAPPERVLRAVDHARAALGSERPLAALDRAWRATA